MKQIIQDLKSGNTILENIPTPGIKPGHVLIQTKNTLVSLGTEKMLVNFGKASYIDKARQQPEKVKQVLLWILPSWKKNVHPTDDLFIYCFS